MEDRFSDISRERSSIFDPRSSVFLCQLIQFAPGLLPTMSDILLQILPALLELPPHTPATVARLPFIPTCAQVGLDISPFAPVKARVVGLFPAIAEAIAHIVPGGIRVVALPLEPIIALEILP